MERMDDTTFKQAGATTTDRRLARRTADETPDAASGMFLTGPIDARSLAYAVGGGTGFAVLALLCLSLSRFDAALASIWLPNAAAVAMLLLARLRNELPAYLAFGLAIFTSNLATGDNGATALGFTLANLTEIAIVTWLTRRVCGMRPDMNVLGSLGRFLMVGGLAGPASSALVAAIVFGPGASGTAASAFSWFLADSMGMILVVPAVLLIGDAIAREERLTTAELAERSTLMIGGLIATCFVFLQDTYPLLFLVPPLTLLMAFRLGGLGTALFVPGIAVVASYMTYTGLGPIMQNHTSEISKIHVLQAFVAVNFLSGLPIAAILEGRSRLVEELFAGRREFALLADNISDAIIKTDLSGWCTYASPSVREVLGRDPRDFVGTNVSHRTHEDASDRINAVLERLQTGESEKERFTYRRLLDASDGTPVFIEADCAVTFDAASGQRDGLIISARDVTERVELELLLTRARRHAENAARAKSEFLANMSHEIRTPMNGVLGFAELMLQGELDSENERYTEMIVESGRSMMLLLNDILDLSKIEAGQIAIEKCPVDLFATLAECATLHRATAEKKGLTLTFGAPCSEAQGCTQDCGKCEHEVERPWVMTDALRLRQIVLNLVGNAVKFTEQGSVEVQCTLHSGSFSVAVHDTGIGISGSRIDTIFAPFTQGESDTERRFGGTGLGLTISRQLAELLGGSITVESEPGVGSTFRLTLPLERADPARRATDKAPDPIEPADLPQAASILLVEDHDVNRLLATEMLERCGQSVAIAHDGNEAIAMVIDSVMRGRPYDLVLMDIQMPGCDGYAATRAIRAEGIGPDRMPIVALTANAFPEDIAAARDAGMQAHLAKPMVFADLARALQRWLPTRIIESGEPDKSRQPRDEKSARAGDREFASEMSALKSRLAGSGRGTARRTDDGGETLRSGGDQPRPAARENEPIAHSSALKDRWTARRSEAIEAVRGALESGVLADDDPESHDELARVVHKLAGTAAIFGEPELGDQAATFERALRQREPAEAREALAFELLSTADDPVDRRAAAGR